jgi:hypothetical protein
MIWFFRQVSRLVCRNAWCSRQGSPHYEGLCPECFVGAGTPPVPGSPSRAIQQPTEARLTTGSHLEARSRNCIMDFCSNAGLAEYKGLCRDCYSAVYQGRVMGDIKQTTVVSKPPTGEIHRHRYILIFREIERPLVVNGWSPKGNHVKKFALPHTERGCPILFHLPPQTPSQPSGSKTKKKTWL